MTQERIRVMAHFQSTYLVFFFLFFSANIGTIILKVLDFKYVAIATTIAPPTQPTTTTIKPRLHHQPYPPPLTTTANHQPPT